MNLLRKQSVFITYLVTSNVKSERKLIRLRTQEHHKYQYNDIWLLVMITSVMITSNLPTNIVKYEYEYMITYFITSNVKSN